jgi:glycerol-3-phosphate dehydrogenase
MARTVDDALSRRTRALILDARAAIEAAPRAAQIMARELGRGADWVQQQINQFQEMAAGYLVVAHSQLKGRA